MGETKAYAPSLVIEGNRIPDIGSGSSISSKSSTGSVSTSSVAPIVQKPVYVPKPAPPAPAGAFDLNRLARAIAIAETSNCTAGVGKSRNNCFGIKGGGSFKVYNSPDESYADFKNLWVSRYGNAYPSLRAATTYVCGGSWPTGVDCPGGSPSHWLARVGRSY